VHRAHLDGELFFMRIAISHEFLGSSVEVLLTDANALPKGRRGRLIQDSDSTSWTTGHVDPIQPGAGLGCSQTNAPDLARRKRIALDRLITMQFGCLDKLLCPVGTQDVAEVCIAELALEDATLLLLHPAPGFQGYGSVQKVGVSRRLHQWRRGGRDRLKQVAESRAERAVVDRTPDLQQQVGASSRPSHLLRLVHPPVDQKVGRAFSQRSSDAQACTVSFGIIDEPSALATEIVIDLAQRVPQLAGWHTRSAMTALALEDMHDLADALECAPGIPGLAVPDPPVQSLDLGDDRRLCLNPIRLVGGQSTRSLLRVLQPHGAVEPVRNWRLRDAGLGQYRSKAGTPVGERGQRGGGSSADRLKTTPEQHRDVRIGFRDSAEDLPTAVGRLDVA